MENNPKKSRALIITIIIILLLLVVGYFLFRNGGISSTNSVIGRMFSSLTPSTNSKSEKAQAGEEINKGDRVYVSSTNSDGSSVVMKVNNSGSSSGKILGTATGSINNGDFGEIIFDTNGGPNNFLNSFSNFLNNIFNNGNGNSNACTNGATNPPLCNSFASDTCTNGATNPPLCNNGGSNDTCLNGASNPPECTTNGDGTCLNGATNPPLCTNFQDKPQCSDTKDNDGDNLIDEADPNCHINGDLTKTYVPLHDSEANSPGTGDAKDPDLTAGDVTPVVAKINKQVKLSSNIKNEGGASTGKSFSVLFTIYKVADNSQINTENNVSKSESKNIIIKLWNKIPSISKVFADTPAGIIQTSKVELVATVATLAKESEKAATANYTFTEIGNYKVQACADKKSAADTGAITESNEDNNCGAWTDLVVSTNPGTGDAKDPDLTAGGITPTVTTTVSPAKLSSTITNIGGGSTIKGFSVLFTINKMAEDSQINTENNVSVSGFKGLISKIANKFSWISKVDAATPIGAIGTDSVSVSVLPIGPNNSKVAIASYKFNSIGVYQIRACADKKSAADTGAITESNENNNCGAWTNVTVTNSIPTGGDTCANGADNYPECTTFGGSCLNGASNPPICDQCANGADDFPSCTNIPKNENACKVIEKNPLVFTEEEKARLAVLLRKFYLISSTLKTNDDIIAIYSEIDQQKNFIKQIEGLTKQCYLETNDSSGFGDFCYRNKGLCSTDPDLIRGPIKEFAANANTSYSSPGNTKNGNPWFYKDNTGTFPYTKLDASGNSFGYTNYNWLEGNYTYDANGNVISLLKTVNGKTIGPGCKAVHGYYYGTGTNPTTGNKFECDSLNNPSEYDCWSGMSTNITNGGGGPDQNNLKMGCKWKEGVYMGDTERILNIW